MAYPSDYRHNPYSDISTAVLTTERHIVPGGSPYIVRLNEVPQKNSPSTITVKEITAINGNTITYGSTFAEVAASPATGDFWPDYSTGADGDPSWNTGKILFASADAGKIVEVIYTATGTLAGVSSNRYPAWWLDRGDGSDGDFAPTTDITISGVKNYKSVHIPAKVTVGVSGFVRIKCQGAFIHKGVMRETVGVSNGGGGGASGSPSERGEPGHQGLSAASGAGGNGNSRWGGAAGAVVGTRDPGQDVVYFGAGGGGGAGGDTGDGGAGGKGGGSITVVAAEAVITGTIEAKGYNGEKATGHYGGGGGGGGGGAIIIVANTVSNSGTYNVSGGSGGTGSGSMGYAGASGGVGFIFVKALGVSG